MKKKQFMWRENNDDCAWSFPIFMLFLSNSYITIRVVSYCEDMFFRLRFHL